MSDTVGKYRSPTFEDVVLDGLGSVKTALESGEAGNLTPEELAQVWAQETTTGGEW